MAAKLEATETGEDELREGAPPKFSQTREAANREGKDQLFTVEHLMQEPSHPWEFFESTRYLKKKINITVYCGE